MEWKKFADEQPQAYELVLGYDVLYEQMYICRFHGGDRLMPFDDRYDDVRITHWMPLPEPPKIEETEVEDDND